MILQYFSRHILFSRTFQESLSYSSIFQACANPESYLYFGQSFPLLSNSVCVFVCVCVCACLRACECECKEGSGNTAPSTGSSEPA